MKKSIFSAGIDNSCPLRFGLDCEYGAVLSGDFRCFRSGLHVCEPEALSGKTTDFVSVQPKKRLQKIHNLQLYEFGRKKIKIMSENKKSTPEHEYLQWCDILRS